MQFTPQQLVGAGRYAPCTRIGNWNEDRMLEEARMQEFQLRKQQGSLLASHKQKHDFLHQRAPRSFDSSGILHFNFAVGVNHLESGGLLVCNVFEETPSVGSGEYLITVTTPTQSKSTMARNTFRILSPQAWKESLASGESFDYTVNGPTLCYGEPFLLMCNEALLVDDKSVLMKPPLFLKSGLKTERSMSPITYNQRIWLGPDADSSALWTCVPADLARTEKMLASGKPVHATDQIAIVHKMTGQPLYAESKNKQPTDYGVELEVCAFGAKTAGKEHNLMAEELGMRTADTEGRVQLAPNIWMFLLANSPGEAKDERNLPSMGYPATVASVIQRCLMVESLYSFRAALVGLMRIEMKGSGHLNREETKWFLKQFHLPLRDEHLDLLFDSFDKRHTGHFPLQSLLDALCLPVSPTRKAAINATYDRLVQHAPDGKLTLAAICEMYDPSIDSRVGAKQITTAEAVAAYRGLWMVSSQTAEITRAEFLEVYSNISMAVVNDDKFYQILEESWK